MAVFKRKYTTKSGKAKTTQKYSLDFRDHDGVMRDLLISCRTHVGR